MDHGQEEPDEEGEKEVLYLGESHRMGREVYGVYIWCMCGICVCRRVI